MWWMLTVASSAELASLPCGHAICAVRADPDSPGAAFEEEPTRIRGDRRAAMDLSVGGDPFTVRWEVVADPAVTLEVESRARANVFRPDRGRYGDWMPATAVDGGWRLADPDTTPPEVGDYGWDRLEIRVRARSGGVQVDQWTVAVEVPSGC